jgi:hypothetical protein
LSPTDAPRDQHRSAGWDVPSGNLNATTSGNAIGLPKRMRAPLLDMFSTMQSMPAFDQT